MYDRGSPSKIDRSPPCTLFAETSKSTSLGQASDQALVQASSSGHVPQILTGLWQHLMPLLGGQTPTPYRRIDFVLPRYVPQ